MESENQNVDMGQLFGLSPNELNLLSSLLEKKPPKNMTKTQYDNLLNKILPTPEPVKPTKLLSEMTEEEKKTYKEDLHKRYREKCNGKKKQRTSQKKNKNAEEKEKPPQSNNVLASAINTMVEENTNTVAEEIPKVVELDDEKDDISDYIMC